MIAYDFNHFRRGVAVLIVNTEFCNVKDNRPRAEKDIDYLTALFEVLDFQIKVLKNKTTRDLMDSLIDIRSQLEKDSDCFACLISTHGGEFPVQGSKNLHQHVLHTFDGSIPTDDIISTFNDNGCAAMRGKPKLFFIQACRGRMDVDDTELVDPGVDVDIITYNSQPPLAGLREESRHVSQHQGQNGTHDCANTHGDGLEKEEGHHGNQLTTQEMVGQEVDLQITGKDHGVTDGDDSKTTTKADAKGRSDDNPARMYGPGYIPFIDGEEDQTYANEEEQRRHREAWCRYQEKVQKDQEQKRRERFLELQLKREMEDADFCSIPCYSHCLVMFSSAPERLAWGDDHTGGWLPYCMYNVVHWFHRYDFRTDLLQVLTEVNNEMAIYLQTNMPSKPEWHQSKSAACIYHMLTKDIYFRLKWSKKAALVTAV
ncbi:uncharacterized protein LOC117323554 [Pecten maximus]|uniref:uncharacterized protein LOC117323554 n=1 Tax=Pecten maximus TaxID=6579 RepID=UPI001458689E|nr:uncharacterized protein LOC117323554 [Pecten maximus]